MSFPKLPDHLLTAYRLGGAIALVPYTEALNAFHPYECPECETPPVFKLDERPDQMRLTVIHASTCGVCGCKGTVMLDPEEGLAPYTWSFPELDGYEEAAAQYQALREVEANVALFHSRCPTDRSTSVSFPNPHVSETPPGCRRDGPGEGEP